MSTQQLIAEFGRLAEAPGAVPRLRQFVRELAMRGRLTGKSNSAASTDESSVGDGEFVVPDGWGWVRVSDVGTSRLGKMLDKAKNRGSPRRYLRNVNVRWFGFDLSDVHQMPFEDSELSEFRLQPGDVLICEGGEPGRAAVWHDEEPGMLFQKAIHRVRFDDRVDPHFFVHAIRDAADTGRLSSYFTGSGIKHFTGAGLASFRFPLPPLAEQRRIVAKVDELMALCDRLEAAQAERERRRDRLAAAACTSVCGADGDSAAAFIIANLDTLAAKPSSISSLRAAFIELGLAGRLTPRSAGDESAQNLLARIAGLRDEWLDSGKPTPEEARTQRRKQDAQALPAHLPPLPQGWGWATLMQCSLMVIDCHNKTAPYVSEGTFLVRTTNVRDGKLNYNDAKFVDDATYARWSLRGAPEPDDFLITREAPMGEACRIPPGEKVCLGQRMMLARIAPGTIDPDYLLYSLRDPRLMDRVQDKPVGATVQHLRVGGVESLLIPLPPREEQMRIARVLDDMMSICDRLTERTSNAEGTRRQFLNALSKAVLT